MFGFFCFLLKRTCIHMHESNATQEMICLFSKVDQQVIPQSHTNFEKQKCAELTASLPGQLRAVRTMLLLKVLLSRFTHHSQNATRQNKKFFCQIEIYITEILNSFRFLSLATHQRHHASQEISLQRFQSEISGIFQALSFLSAVFIIDRLHWGGIKLKLHDIIHIYRPICQIL